MFNAAAMTRPTNTIRTKELLECWGPVGKSGPLTDLRTRFGEWRKIGDGYIYGIHDRHGVGATYRVADGDLAIYWPLSFAEFKGAFGIGVKEDNFLHTLAVANATYVTPDEGDKYLGLAIWRFLLEHDLF